MSEMLNTLRLLDTRVLRNKEELAEVAKLYNVKARIWKVGIPLRDIDKKVFQLVRDTAVTELCLRGGGTVDALCLEIERLIDDGRCGLGKNTFLPKNRRVPDPSRRKREPMPASERLFADLVREGQNGRRF